MAEKLNNYSSGDFSFQNSLLDDFRYSSGSLELTIISDTRTFKLLFDWIHSFRLTDEGDLLKMQDEQQGNMVTGIYSVENSSYLKWFNEQSADVHSTGDIVHYFIVTTNEVIDVLSSEEPLVTHS